MIGKTKFLFLNENDVIRAGCLDYPKCINVIEEIFGLISDGDYVMGGVNHNSHGIALEFPKESKFPNMPLDAPDRRFMAMPAYVGGRFNVAGVKWYGSNIQNANLGLPRSILTVMLNDPITCEPIALMSANLISTVRTGAVPGVAVRHLANRDAEVVAAIGAGPISRACLEAIVAEAKGLREIAIYDIADKKAEALAAYLKEKTGINARCTANVQEAVKHADIISVAASALKPVNLRNEWLKKGSLLIFTGRCNVDEDYYLTSRIIWDNAKMHGVYYDEHLQMPGEEAFASGIGVQIYKMAYEKKIAPVADGVSLGDIIRGSRDGRQNADDRICFVAGGMPLWDIGWGFDIYSRAQEMGLGTWLKLWDSPYLA